MSPIDPFRLSVLTTSLFVATATAQDPVEAIDARILPRIEQHLDAVAPAKVAWGGYLAQRYRVRGATGPLCRALDRWRDRSDLDARLVRLHLVDGLLGTGAPVPAEQVEPLLADPLTRPAAFAVMARDARANQEGLVRLALAPAPGGDLVRLAAARLLIVRRLREPRLGRHVVENLSTRVIFTVFDDGPVEGLGEIGIGGGFAAREFVTTQPGWPPLVRLAVTDAKTAEHTVAMVVPGRGRVPPVLLTRFEGARYAKSQLEAGQPASTFRQRRLVELLDLMTGVEVPLVVTRRHRWQDAETLRAAFVEVRDQQCAVLDRATAELRRRGWLGKDALAGFRIELREQVVDDRGDQREPLPELPEAPPVGG